MYNGLSNSYINKPKQHLNDCKVGDHKAIKNGNEMSSTHGGS